MLSNFESYQKRRLRSSYFSVVISIALVLFMVGFLGLVLLKSTQVANYFKEEVVITLFLKNDTSNPQIESLRNSLIKEEFTRKIVYISKVEAAKFYSEDLGEDFVNYLGTNPLKNSIDIYLNPGFVTPEKMGKIANEFKNNAYIFEVSYDKPLVTFLTQNIQKVSFWLFVISSFFGLVALILINSSIRLSVYSKRFNIKTMQMVGATKQFIRKPFVLHNIRLGVLGALVGIGANCLLIYYLNTSFPELKLIDYPIELGILFLCILGIGIVITWISTHLATQRFLNLKTDQLYY